MAKRYGRLKSSIGAATLSVCLFGRRLASMMFLIRLKRGAVLIFHGATLIYNDDIVETDQDVPVTIPEADLLANGTDVHGDSLNITAIDKAVKGRIRISGNGIINFMTGRRFSGDGSFQYTIDAGNGGTDTATVTMSSP